MHHFVLYLQVCVGDRRQASAAEVLVSNCCLILFSRLQTKVQEGVDQTLGVAEKSISDAEAWDKPNNLSKEMEQATAQMQQSMVNIICYIGYLYRF